MFKQRKSALSKLHLAGIKSSELDKIQRSNEEMKTILDNLAPQADIYVSLKKIGWAK